MKGQTKERWEILCEQAAKEQNPKRLMGLVAEITQLLDEKRNRITQQMFRPRAESSQEHRHA
jgi:hypothetical protein